MRSDLNEPGTRNFSHLLPRGKHDVDLTTIVYSPPLNDNWRGFAGFGYADGQFSEGKGIVRDWLAGVEWRSRNIWLEAE
ncbi:hypothetical protein KX262_18590, partial [Escherichia coli]|nr:hypothetical protein [Escherichia coli]